MQDIIFLSYRGAPPRAPNVRSSAKDGAAASKEEQQTELSHLSLLNIAIFRPGAKNFGDRRQLREVTFHYSEEVLNEK